MKDLVPGGKWWRANLRQGLEEALRSLGLRQGTGVTRATTHMKQGVAAETSHLLHTVVRTWDGAGRREAWRTLFFSAEAGRSRRCTSTRQRCAGAPRPCLTHSRRATAVSYSMRSCGRQHPAVRLSVLAVQPQRRVVQVRTCSMLRTQRTTNMHASPVSAVSFSSLLSLW